MYKVYTSPMPLVSAGIPMKREVYGLLLLLLLAIPAGLTACGNKGPLYLPEDKQAPAEPAAAPAE
jgi:predicted small lipoprotein YifL